MDRKISVRRRQLKPFAQRAKDHCRQFTAFMFSNVGIIILVVVYMIGGAFIFLSIESEQNHFAEELNVTMIAYRANLTAQLWQITLTVNTFEHDKYVNQVGDEILKYQQAIVYAVKHGWPGSYDKVVVNTWSITTALLYSLTVITTIGYGLTTPTTTKGKIVTIIYAIVGMPLFLLYLSNIGDVMAKSFKWIYAKVCLCRICPGVAKRRAYRTKRKIRALALDYDNDCPSDDEDEIDEESTVSSTSSSEHKTETGQRIQTVASISSSTSSSTKDSANDTSTVSVPITTSLMIIIGYIVMGATIFQRDLLTGCYFCFVSLSSIGFGDVISEKFFQAGDPKVKNLAKIDAQFIICVIYLLLGMALIAMCFNLMQEQVINNMRAIKSAIKRCFRCSRCCKSKDIDDDYY